MYKELSYLWEYRLIIIIIIIFFFILLLLLLSLLLLLYFSRFGGHGGLLSGLEPGLRRAGAPPHPRGQ